MEDITLILFLILVTLVFATVCIYKFLYNISANQCEIYKKLEDLENGMH